MSEYGKPGCNPGAPVRRVLITSTAVLALLAGALIAGCGASGGKGGTSGRPSTSGRPATPPTAPAGYSRIASGGVSLSHPPGWTRAQAPAGWTMAMELRKDGAAIARLGVIRSVPQSDDPGTVATAAFAGVQLSSRIERRSPNAAVRVPGAKAAVRVDYEYEDSVTGNKARGTDLSVVLGASRALVVRVTGLRDDLPQPTIDRIVASVIVSPA